MSPHFGIHANLGKAWDGVDLVDDEIVIFCHEEIHAAHAFAAKCFKNLNGHFANIFALGRGEIGWDLEFGAVFVEVFGFVRIKIMLR